MALTCVTLDKADGIARVTLNRPAQMNAISPELLEDLWRVCEDVERDPAVKVVTLTGAGRAFCAGADLKAVRELAIAGEEARLGDQHANFGLVAGGGGSQRLPRVVGPRRAKELMRAGREHAAILASEGRM